MPRAAGPYIVLEKINDNAYKLELPSEFRINPTFNISDLKPYLGEEDELESRTTPLQEGRMMRTSLPWIQTTLLKLMSKVQLLAHALTIEFTSELVPK